MRIIHVVTLVTPDGRFGGPVTVAFDLAREQMKAGHEVLVMAASLGFQSQTTTISGVPVKLFPGRWLTRRLGYSGLIAPGLSRAVVREGSHPGSVVHVHLARDLITSSAADRVRRKGIPYALQTHGMIDASSRRLAAVIDWISIAPIVRGALRIYALTIAERDELRRLGANASRIEIMPNGVAPRPKLGNFTGARDSILFLARLHPRKGGILFVEAALRVCRKNPSARFTIAGPDEGDLAGILATLEANPCLSAQVDVVGAVPHERVFTLMSSARAYVLPAEYEPFGLSILEAMSASTPVIVHETANLAQVIVESGAGLSFSGDATNLADKMAELLDQPLLAKSMGHAGAEVVERNYSIAAISDRVTRGYT